MFSVWATLFPIVLCILILKKGSREIRLFFLFFIFVFLTDISIFALSKAGMFKFLEIFSISFPLAESSFFYWLVWKNVDLKFKSLVGWLTFTSLLYWIGLAILNMDIGLGNILVGQLFYPVYEILVSILAGFILLKMVEKEDLISDKPMFWIFQGMFFYFFNTFFLSILFYSPFFLNFWFLNNIFYIISLGFYTFGLWKYYKIQKMG